MLPPTHCSETFHRRFLLLTLAADAVRKSSNDARKELELLRQCLPLVGGCQLVPAAPDSSNLLYMMHMNRGNAARRLARLDEAARSKLLGEAVQAHQAALQAAREPTTQLKCLVYVGWDYLYMRDEDAYPKA